MAEKVESLEAVKRGVQFSSEVLVPGGSNLIKGDLVNGGIYAALGFMAKSMFGLPGLIIVSTDSFTKAVTGRHIYEHLGFSNDTPEAGSTHDKKRA